MSFVLLVCVCGLSPQAAEQEVKWSDLVRQSDRAYWATLGDAVIRMEGSLRQMASRAELTKQQVAQLDAETVRYVRDRYVEFCREHGEPLRRSERLDPDREAKLKAKLTELLADSHEASDWKRIVAGKMAPEQRANAKAGKQFQAKAFAYRVVLRFDRRLRLSSTQRQEILGGVTAWAQRRGVPTAFLKTKRPSGSKFWRDLPSDLAEVIKRELNEDQVRKAGLR